MNTVISIDEFIQRIGMQPPSNIWSVLIVITEDREEIIEELTSAIEVFAECKLIVISGENGVDELVERVKDAAEDYLLLSNLDNWQEVDWKKLDGYRSRLDRHKLGGLLLLSNNAASKMVANAPNFSSWLGSRIYSLKLDADLLTEEEKESRLIALRAWSSKSDADIIKLAEANQLPPDFEYGEWLMLLDRGDLIER